jgi:hypothetical protein
MRFGETIVPTLRSGVIDALASTAVVVGMSTGLRPVL